MYLPPETATPPISFFIGDPPVPISERVAQWGQPLPLTRLGRSSDPVPEPNGVSYGDYFTAVSDFLTRDRMAVCRRAIARASSSTAADAPIDAIRVHLVKHGALYHPARVSLTIAGTAISMVVNVAVSPAGQEKIADETEHLSHLNQTFAGRFLPEVYHIGSGKTADGLQLPMFAGEWLTGYHEVHLTNGSRDEETRHLVWDPDQGPWYLSAAQSSEFYRQATFILTACFDPWTLSVIQQWHHAAGDFIIQSTPQGIDLRLITVRRYGPFIQLNAQDRVDLETLLEGLALFFLRTSLWMRIDRVDGVGDLVWAPDAWLPAIWQGFCQGIEQMVETQGLPREFVAAGQQYLASYPQDDLIDLGRQMLARYPAMPEVALIRNHLERHVAQMHGVMQQTR